MRLRSTPQPEPSSLFQSPWEILETLFAEHGDGGIEIWRGEDGSANVDVDTERGTGASLATAVGDVLVKLGPPETAG